jgi:hypothetical protein
VHPHAEQVIERGRADERPEPVSEPVQRLARGSQLLCCGSARPGSRSYAAAMTGIEGKVVAITGASSGIGEATALLLAERGAKVVLGSASTGSPQGSGPPASRMWAVKRPTHAQT